MLYDSNFMAFRKRQNCGDNKITGCQGLRGGRGEQELRRGFVRQ